jgi:hypothetical protein
MRWELSDALPKLVSWEQLPEAGRLWVGIRWPEQASFGGKCSVRVFPDSQRVEILPLAAPVGGMLPSCLISFSLSGVVEFIYNASEDPPFFPEVRNPEQFTDWLILQFPLERCDVFIGHLKPNVMP